MHVMQCMQSIMRPKYVLDELAASDTPSGMDSSADSVWKIKGNS